MSDLRTEPQPGRTGRASVTVNEDLTAIALGSGDVPVYGTPAVLALLEAAAVDALAGALPDGKTSVGVQVTLDHLAASKVGATVDAVATLDSVDGRRLSFTCEAREGDTVIARATHRRVIVDRASFGA
ncbi:MAG TPA: hotdog domain-containing protein [Actinomycetota bacterium]|nr:hotdog domain-containing protein [Actinomycetota bacterium]